MIRTISLTSFTLCAAVHLLAVQKNLCPNIVYILADDLGYGDLGCYGQTKFTTPNIDKMAQEGMRFTQHYSGSTVSAPTRACLMTGLHTGHSFIRGNSDNVFPATVQTFPKMLQREGYVTGMYGKWGLGNYPSTGEPDDHGFNEFFGCTNQGLAHRHYPDVLINNGETVPLPGNDWLHTVVYEPDTVHRRALDFIDRHRNEPFFLYCAYTIPHAELIVPEDSIIKHYRGKFPETPKAGSDYIGEGTNKTAYCSQEYPRATYAAMISRLDLYVGQILKKLKALGLSDNTIVMFSSDNGPESIGDPAFFNSSGGLHGIKRDIYEGGIRAPFIVQWPGKIAPGTVSEHICAQWDIFPTIKELVASSEEYAGDGISLLPTLLGNENQQQHTYLYWEFYEKNGRRGIRYGDWKLVQYNVSDGPNAKNWLLYNLKNDPTESINVAAANLDIRDKLKNAVELEHIKSEKLQWTFENNTSLFNVKIVVTDKNGMPVPDAKVILGDYGNRVTWEEGLAMFRGISAGNPILKIIVEGRELCNQTVTINDGDLVLPVILDITGQQAVMPENQVICFFDKSMNAIRLKSEQPIVRYRLLNALGQAVNESNNCAGTYINISINHPGEMLYFVETVTISGKKQMIKVVCS